MTPSPDGPLTLMYHRIGIPRRHSKASVHYVSPRAFAWQMKALRQLRMQVVDLNVVAAHTQGAATLTGRQIAITFDDGFDNLYHHAFPILKLYRFPAAIFVVSHYIGRTSDFDPPDWDREPLLNEDRILEMHGAGILFGSHSRRHPRLPDCDGGDLYDEIAGSRKDLEALLKSPVKAFCYPFGAQNDLVRAAVIDAGYDFACSTKKGRNHTGVDPFLLRRINIRSDTSRALFLYKIARARLFNR